MIDLDAIKSRYVFLGEQPWRVGRKVGRTLYRQARKSGPDDIDNLIGVMDNEDDATFIAHARTDVPALVAEVERLAEQNDGLYLAVLAEGRQVERLKATLAAVVQERDALAARVVELEPSGSFRVDL